jgi:hypothetical protein
MSLTLLLRRLHLYLGLSLSPWFLIYGVSSVVFNHPQYFNGLCLAVVSLRWSAWSLYALQ